MITLSDAEQNSPLWKKIQEHLNSQKTKHMAKLCDLSITEKKADQLRGGIAELEALLSAERGPATQ